ncbi:MAG: hypothetical protein JWM11_8045 [Planctomycetaceae bacterium]|nr:hypothetical protein [Planctomycetaceae bacterium]
MSNPGNDKRMVWMLLGLVAGLGIATLWPHEQVKASATDRDAQFAMSTCSISAIGNQEAIFVLDFLTGSLKGAILGSGGDFTHFFFRDLPVDFKLDPKKEAHYCLVTGGVQLQGDATVPPAPSIVYIGELTTGRIIAYSFGYRDGTVSDRPVALLPIATFPFRQPDPGAN